MVYLICFDKPYHHARHYIGYVGEDVGVEARLEAHRKNKGARLLRALNIAGIGYKVVRVWESGDKTFERKLKNRKKSKTLCPCCSEHESK